MVRCRASQENALMKPREATIRNLRSSYDSLRAELQRSLQRRGSSREQAEDLVSASFAALLSLSDEQLAQVSNQRAYLHGIARNLQVRAITDSQRNVATPDDQLDRAEDDPAFAYLETQDARSLALDAFEKVTPRQQQVLWLATVENRSAKSIASELSMTVTNVTSLTSRAKLALREAYIAALLARKPPPCGFDVRDLARIATGTAPQRLERKCQSHADTCSDCPQLLDMATEELRWGYPLLAAVALGGIAGGVLTEPLDSASAAGNNTSSRIPLVLALGGLLFALIWLTGASIVNMAADAHTVPITIGTTDTASNVDVDATPSSQSLYLPGPGETMSWKTQILSNSTERTHLFASLHLVDESHTTQSATLRYGFAWKGGEVAVPLPPAGSDQSIYLGTMAPGDVNTLTGFVMRDDSDTDQTATATVAVTLLVSNALAEGVDIGDRVPDASTFLAATGLGQNRLGVTLACSLVLVLTGLALVEFRRQSRG